MGSNKGLIGVALLGGGAMVTYLLLRKKTSGAIPTPRASTAGIAFTWTNVSGGNLTAAFRFEIGLGGTWVNGAWTPVSTLANGETSTEMRATATIPSTWVGVLAARLVADVSSTEVVVWSSDAAFQIT